MWIQKYCQVNEIKLAYWENEGNANETMVFLPGGNSSGMHLKHMDEELNPNIRFIVPDYPGRGGSESLPINSNIESIAKYLLGLFENLKLKDFTLIGHSFGWAIADQIVKENKNLKIKHLVFIDPGEFIWHPLRLPLKILFYLPMHSQKLRVFFWFVICKILHIYDFESIACDKLFDLGQQWQSVLNFKIKPHHKSQISTLLVRSLGDRVSDNSHLEILKMIYPNSWEIYLPIPHIMDYDDKDGLARTVLFPAIGKEIGHGILR